jgi:hypothetical protein
VEKLMIVVVAGYAVFGIFYALGRPLERPPLDPQSLVWILPWFTGLLVISYFGQYGGTKLIPEWVDLGVVAAFSLGICYIAVRLSLPSERVADVINAHTLEPMYAPIKDLPFPGGVIRQLRYGQNEIAVLDASVEVIAANWTARVGPAVFVSETDRLVSLDENMDVILSVSPNSEIQKTTMSGLRDMLIDKNFHTACQFLRLDLSTTQSAFWERLPDEGLTVVGFSGYTSTFTGDTKDAVGLVEHLLAATATPAVNLDQVRSSVQTLARRYANRKHPDDTGAPV